MKTLNEVISLAIAICKNINFTTTIEHYHTDEGTLLVELNHDYTANTNNKAAFIQVYHEMLDLLEINLHDEDGTLHVSTGNFGDGMTTSLSYHYFNQSRDRFEEYAICVSFEQAEG